MLWWMSSAAPDDGPQIALLPCPDDDMAEGGRPEGQLQLRRPLQHFQRLCHLSSL